MKYRDIVLGGRPALMRAAEDCDRQSKVAILAYALSYLCGGVPARDLSAIEPRTRKLQKMISFLSDGNGIESIKQLQKDKIWEIMQTPLPKYHLIWYSLKTIINDFLRKEQIINILVYQCKVIIEQIRLESGLPIVVFYCLYIFYNS